MKTKKFLALILSLIMILANVNVFATENEALTTMHNIAKNYSGEAICSDSNIYWLIADMADYKKAFPDSENVLDESVKQACLDKLIDFADNATKPGDLSKAIVALRALGYDAKNVYTKEEEKLDVVAKLTSLVDEQASSVTNVYTLPYVIIALQQGEDYATKEQMDYLIDSAISQKASWQSVMWGPDGATPMMLALSTYYDTNENVKTALDETVLIVKETQGDDGLIYKNAASTGLAMAAFASIGIECETVIKNEKSIIDGLMSQASEELNAFKPLTNTFSTEQGFRGLVAWRLSKQGKRIFDFKDFPENEAKATWAENCPVVFEVVPEDVVVAVEGAEPVSDKTYDLAEGSYNYTVSKEGYISAGGVLEVLAEDAQNHVGKNVSVTLEKKESTGGGNLSSEITVKIKIMEHDGAECDNSYTYKNNSKNYSAIVDESIKVAKNATVLEALKAVLEANDIEYEENGGYVSSINGLAELEHGDNSGWMFNLNGKLVEKGADETELSGNDSVVWFYTDDYTKERGTEKYMGGSLLPTGSKNTSSEKAEEVKKEEKAEEKTEEEPIKDGLPDKNPDVKKREIINPEKSFEDIKTHESKEIIEALAERGIVSGMNEKEFCPDKTMTRAEFATIVVNSLCLPEKSGAEFEDVLAEDWFFGTVNTAFSYGIVSGVSETSFNPQGTITREEAMAMVARAAKLCGMDTETDVNVARNILAEFTDYKNISDWAVSSAAFCYRENILDKSVIEINPKEEITRADMAQMLYNMLKEANLI